MSNVVFFDGVDDVVNCGNNVSLQLTTALTFEVLVKIREYKTYVSFVNKWNLNGFAFCTYLGGGRAVLYLDPGAAAVPSTANIFPLNEWVRGGVTWTNNNPVRFYKNGQYIEQSGNKAGLVDSGGNLLLGGPGGGFNYPPIIMAQVCIYNRQLTDTEMAYNAMHPNNPVRRGLALNLTQDSIQGAQWLDLSGNNNHGTYTNGAVPVSANLLAGR